MLIAIATGMSYDWVVNGEAGFNQTYAAVGILAGLGYSLAFLIRDEYAIEVLLAGRRSPGRVFLTWSLVFIGLAVIGLLTNSTNEFSHGWLAVFFVLGLASVLLFNSALSRAAVHIMSRGWIRWRKVMIVATDGDVSALEREINGAAAGFWVIARTTVPNLAQEPNEIDAVLDAAIAKARMLGVEDVIISHALVRSQFLERAVNAFSVLPVALHLSTSGFVRGFKDARIARFGETTTISLTRPPLGPLEAAVKRWFDMVAAGVALTLLSPLFAVIAVLIKLDSRGPVFFKQRRRGYNTAEFQIWKFRTMTSLDDGDVIVQATENDGRVTAFGNILRRTSLDELPQLINVLKGEMSLVGPRPHAVAHDRYFERHIERYPRRLNVKPGITGWAQVNGFRGETRTDEAMRQRVDHDLYYIDNCSVGFDLYILLLTLISPKAKRNAR
ncbi:exopolysaccharide biosynthesis polyprenyl glycosylphosphotransferase [Hyphomicrobium sp.]|uniref:exopolysaccharide biosynthesis polyprenyl glycosylphosphotransferase n=1 Tax=Hyphomicrobium sp. TaxID=82 RepID=UPI0025BBAA30|nr:exopolysaccharide biosynthesis polyprenyl glycosylphosphotransferase [Hyphomicrobium sp.]